MSFPKKKRKENDNRKICINVFRILPENNLGRYNNNIKALLACLK